MNCPHCRANYTADANLAYCPNCGNQLPALSLSPPAPYPAPSGQQAYPQWRQASAPSPSQGSAPPPYGQYPNAPYPNAQYPNAQYPYGSSPVTQPPLTPAGTLLRIGAYFVDSLILLPVALLNFIPVAGEIVYAMIAFAYYLCRDIQGASIGKRLFGLQVLSASGTTPPRGPLVLRNVLFAIPLLAFGIPLAGVAIGPIADTIFLLIELILLVLTGRRLGDRMADTIVVKTR